jgi:Ca-activated chloride channel family protein
MNPLIIPWPGPDDIRLAFPWGLLALLLLPLVYLAIRQTERKTSQNSSLRHSNLAWVKKAGGRNQDTAWRYLRLARVLSLGLLGLCLAQPQFGRVERQTWSEGIDIVLVLDLSDSMRTPDFMPNRLVVSKEVVRQFVSRRDGDRLGLVVFATEALTISPLTLDIGAIDSFIDRLDFGIIDGNSTAIGMGLAAALNQLRQSDSKSRVVLLLTDGENNAGRVDPITAAEAARSMGVRLYNIGVTTFIGGPGGRDSEVDQKALTQMAEMTGGKFFLASDRRKLEEIYAQIDRLERTRIESTRYDNFQELSPFLILLALGMLMGELGFRAFRYVRIP